MYQSNRIVRLPLDNLEGSPELIYPLPLGQTPWGDIIPTPQGGILVAHVDGFDSRLLEFSAAGDLIWERSFVSEGVGSARLADMEGQLYLILETPLGQPGSELAIYAVDPRLNTMIHVMSGGTRQRRPNDTWVESLGENGLLVNIGGGAMFRFEPDISSTSVSPN